MILPKASELRIHPHTQNTPTQRTSQPSQFPLLHEPITMITIKGCRMGRSDKVSLWYVTLLIYTRFRFFYLRMSNCVKRI